MNIRLQTSNSETATRTQELYSRVSHISMSSSEKRGIKQNTNRSRQNIRLEARLNGFKKINSD